MKKDILILSLGTGSVFGKSQDEPSEEDRAQRLREAIEKNEYCYRPTTYCMPGKEVSPENQNIAFIAECLIRETHPDDIYIIGTVRSSWTQFYANFTRNISDVQYKYDRMKPINDMEKQYGKDTSSAELDECQKKLNLIFNEDIQLDGSPRIRVILIRYGLNNEELMENYARISQAVSSSFEEGIGIQYNISFDITHSFRSLPFYNLVLVNYLKQVSPYNIHIQHVFYGNLDISHENNKIAPVLDLVDMVKLMDLTNGVSEFKNTGNAVGLLKELEETGSGRSTDHIRQAVEAFDWSTQVNSRSAIAEAISAIQKAVSENSETALGGAYADLGRMLKDALDYRFTVDGQELPFSLWEEAARMQARVHSESEGSTLADYHFDNADFQLALTCWYMHQNRYGLAIVTALETLRSYMVPFYLDYCDMKVSEENCRLETNRKTSQERLYNIQREETFADQIQQNIADHLVDMANVVKEVKKKSIRDAFAHNLETDTQVDIGVKSIIETFIVRLCHVAKDIHEHLEEFASVYSKEYQAAEMTARDHNSQNVSARVIICTKAGTWNEVLKSGKNPIALKDKLSQSSSKKKYKVYRLPDALISMLSDKNETIYARAYLLCKYLNTQIDRNDALSDMTAVFVEKVNSESGLKSDLALNHIFVYMLRIMNEEREGDGHHINCAIFNRDGLDDMSNIINEDGVEVHLTKAGYNEGKKIRALFDQGLIECR